MSRYRNLGCFMPKRLEVAETVNANRCLPPVLGLDSPVGLSCRHSRPERTRRWLALSFAAILASVLMVDYSLAHEDRDDPAQSLVVRFSNGESAAFAISKGSIASITLHVGKSDCAVPQNECSKIHDVHFESVTLYWNGVYRNAAAADYFYIGFDLGPETERKFGELPRVRLIFRNGKFARGVLTRKTDDRTWYEYNLWSGEEEGKITTIDNVSPGGTGGKRTGAQD